MQEHLQSFNALSKTKSISCTIVAFTSGAACAGAGAGGASAGAASAGGASAGAASAGAGSAGAAPIGSKSHRLASLFAGVHSFDVPVFA